MKTLTIALALSTAAAVFACSAAPAPSKTSKAEQNASDDDDSDDDTSTDTDESTPAKSTTDAGTAATEDDEKWFQCTNTCIAPNAGAKQIYDAENACFEACGESGTDACFDACMTTTENACKANEAACSFIGDCLDTCDKQFPLPEEQ